MKSKPVAMVPTSDAIDMLDQSFENKLSDQSNVKLQVLHHPLPTSALVNAKASTTQIHLKPQRTKRTVKKSKVSMPNEIASSVMKGNDDMTTQEIYHQIVQLQSELGYYEQIIGKRSALNPVEEELPSYDAMRSEGQNGILKYMVQLMSQCMTHLLQAEVRHHEMHSQLQTLSETVNGLSSSYHQTIVPSVLEEVKSDRPNHQPSVEISPPAEPVGTEEAYDQQSIVHDDSELFLSSDSSFEANEQQSFISHPSDKNQSKPTSPTFETTPFKALSSPQLMDDSTAAVPPSLGTSPSDWLLASIHSSQMNTTSSPFRSGAMTSPIALRDIHINLPLSETSPSTSLKGAVSENLMTNITGNKLQANLFPSPPKTLPGELTSLSNEMQAMSIKSRASPVSVLQGVDSPMAVPASDEKAPLRATPSPTQAPIHPFKQLSYDARMGSY